MAVWPPDVSMAAELINDAPCGFLVTDLNGGVLFSNQTLAKWLGRTADELQENARIRDILSETSHLYFETQIAPMIHLQGFAREISCTLRTSDAGQSLPVLMNAMLRKGTEEVPERIDYVFFDATERSRFEAQLMASRSEAEELAAIVRSAAVGIARTDDSGRLKRLNAAASNILGVDPEVLANRTVNELLALDAPKSNWFAHAQQLIEKTGTEHRFEANAERSAVYDISVAKIAIPEEPYTPADYSVIIRDVTERVRTERRLNLLVAELNHRARNTFTVINGIVRQTLRGPTLAEEREKLVDRLQSISASHDVLTSNYWDSVNILELISLLRAQTDDSQLISSEGPDVSLNPKQFKALSMAFHELSTNARKYGALSVPGGSIAVNWSLEGPDKTLLEISWREAGGPTVKAPEKSGFGTVMIKQMLAAEFDGEAEINYRPEGLEMVCRGTVKPV